MNKKFARLSLPVVLALVLAFGAFTASHPAAADGQSGTTLTATKTIVGHYTRTFHWTIDKSVTPDTWNLFRGDSGTSEYTVAVTKDEGTLEGWVDGQICVTNGGAVATEDLQIVDELRDGVPPPNDLIATTNVDVSSNPVLDPGETGCYDYHIDLTGANIHPGGTYKNTANVTITNHSGSLGTPFGPSPSATTTFPATPTLINDSITVADTNGGSWSFSDDGSVSYTKKFTCDGDEGQHDNTATIVETGQSDSASVTVNCYALEVTKDASTSFTRTYHWSIDKSADQSSLTLSTGQSFLVNYTVVVNVTDYTDSDFAVSGNITVHNPAPIDATINSVSDVISGVGPADNVDCGVSFPYTLAAGGTLNCTYSSALPDASSRTNTATATLQNYDYDKDGNGTASGTTDFSGTADVDFGSATITEVDKCITVSDSLQGNLGTVCVGDAPKTFTYSRTIGPYSVCGDYTVDNTASFTTNDTGTTGSDSWSVAVNVPCVGGCTLTQGYWKTHSEFGPAPYDNTWAQLPNGASTLFFNSGQTWYQVFWTAPAGNAYYILAQQYMAAKLNILNGASSTPAVNTAMAGAEALFMAQGPGDTTLTKQERTQALAWAATLDQYNNGLIGPGHCSE